MMLVSVFLVVVFGICCIFGFLYWKKDEEVRLAKKNMTPTGVDSFSNIFFGGGRTANATTRSLSTTTRERKKTEHDNRFVRHTSSMPTINIYSKRNINPSLKIDVKLAVEEGDEDYPPTIEELKEGMIKHNLSTPIMNTPSSRNNEYHAVNVFTPRTPNQLGLNVKN
eukprot:UN30335